MDNEYLLNEPSQKQLLKKNYLSTMGHCIETSDLLTLAAKKHAKHCEGKVIRI